MGLSISTDWKGNSYNSILVIINWLIKKVYYNPVQITIDILRLTEVILDIMVWHYGLSNSIISNRGLVFTLKFWFSLYYFLGIK